MIQKRAFFMGAILIAAIVGVAQGAEERKLPRLVDQCKTSCVTSAKGDAKKQASCEHACVVIFDGGAKKKVAQDATEGEPAPTEGEEWRVRYACGQSCQSSLWLCEDGCSARNLPANSSCNAECSGGYHSCNDMCDTMFPFLGAPVEGIDE